MMGGSGLLVKVLTVRRCGLRETGKTFRSCGRRRQIEWLSMVFASVHSRSSGRRRAPGRGGGFGGVSCSLRCYVVFLAQRAIRTEGAENEVVDCNSLRARGMRGWRRDNVGAVFLDRRATEFCRRSRIRRDCGEGVYVVCYIILVRSMLVRQRCGSLVR